MITKTELPFLSSEYSNTQSKWETYSALRTRPRRFVKDYLVKEEDLFPTSKQPILIHPLLSDITFQQREYILIQTLYRYMNDIAHVELNIINDVSNKVIQDAYYLKFPKEMKHDILSVIIDEGYHAYVAHDFMQQVNEITGISPLALPESTELLYAIKESKKLLNKEYHDSFDIMAVCVSEYALTTDIYNVAKEKKVSKAFTYIMKDHALDEGRHAKIFQSLLELFWKNLDETSKKVILNIIPNFLNFYLTTHIQKKHTTQILKELNFNDSDIQTIIEDTFIAYTVSDLKHNSVIKAVIELFKKVGMYEDPHLQDFFENQSSI